MRAVNDPPQLLWPRNGEPCVTLLHPTVDGVKYPPGSFINLNEYPLWAYHPLCLRQYLQVMGIKLRQKERRRTLCKLVKQVMRQKRKPLTLEVHIYINSCAYDGTNVAYLLCCA